MPQHVMPITGIDTHAHIFSRDLPLTENRRYSPDYDALVESYLAHLEHCGLSHGVLVQPSFLGINNNFMVAALRVYPERLRGTAVVSPEVSDAELDELEKAGVVGVRLNLVGLPLEDYSQPRWKNFFKKMVDRNWSVEIQRAMEDLCLVVPVLLDTGVSVIIDHFGLPAGCIDPEIPEHQAFLSLLPDAPVWIKLSATYRSKATQEQAATMVDLLRKAYGHSDHFLWGSDWPHTRFEKQTNYDAQFSIMNSLLPDAMERRKVLVDNPARLFKFNP
ncbi:amidohydrolase family protein [Pseudomonas asuensis]|uniref:Hydrolase n=1 Tax=Pseudomonas asuensis TaxID=1825787 RepID=A0ABQ2GWH6_9PSED|nr:amidohydrolase family protein [Pseudomonas asuensis]GGM17140.1 hydrolase [Pseudomonas asuensis]